MKRNAHCLILLSSFATMIGLLSATSVRTVNLDEMVGYADRVFLGRCIGVQEAESQMGFPVVAYTFEVLEGIKGIRTGERVQVRQVASGKTGMPGIPGMPSYRQGQKLVLFLHGDSQLGLTSPVGFGQGVFELLQEPDGLKVVNGLGNQNLTYNLSLAQGRDAGLSEAQFEVFRKSGPVRFDALATAVRQIERSYQNGRKSIR